MSRMTLMGMFVWLHPVQTIRFFNESYPWINIQYSPQPISQIPNGTPPPRSPTDKNMSPEPHIEDSLIPHKSFWNHHKLYRWHLEIANVRGNGDVDVGKKCHCLDIPYGTNAITSSSELTSVGCVVYNPLRILICFTCQIAVMPSSLGRHCRARPHFNSLINDVFVNTLVTHHNLYLDDNFPANDAPKTPVPGIPWEDGYACHVDGCGYAVSSLQSMKRHLSKEHKITRVTLPMSSVQVIFDSNQKRYHVNAPSLTNSSSESTSILPSFKPLEILLEQHSNRIPRALDTPDDPAFLNPFLQKYLWLGIVKDLPPSKIRGWVSLPGNTILEKLEVAVDRYYLKICKEMELWEKHTTSLRWVNSTKECAFTAWMIVMVLRFMPQHNRQ